MSLSFVSKSIQTTTEDGSFVEKPVEGSADDDAGGGSLLGEHRPLFEQLRSNQERRDAEEEEYQRSMMRGTLALDEEDEAHLSSLRRQREREEMELRQRTDQELAAFRAARLDRFSTATGAATATILSPDDAGGGDRESLGELGAEYSSSIAALPPTKSAATSSSSSVAPKASLPVIIKRKKRGSSEVDAKSTDGPHPASECDNKKCRPDETGDPAGAREGTGESSADTAKVPPTTSTLNEAGSSGGLGGLLSGYDSSSDDEE